MLELSSLFGRSVQTKDGTVVGRLRDVSARLDGEHPLASRLAIGTRRHAKVLVPWAEVSSLGPSGVWLASEHDLPSSAVAATEDSLLADELLLRRDVLDTQVIDVDKVRMARVSEVFLDQLPDGRLELAAVDVGMEGVVRRLGLPRGGPRRVVDVSDLHLTSGRGHSLQLVTRSAAVHRMDARGLAELLTRLEVERAAEVLEAVGPQRAAVAVHLAHPAVGDRLMLALTKEAADRLLEKLPAKSASHFRRLRSSATPLTRRRLFRHRGWRIHRPPSSPPPATTSSVRP